MAAKTKEAKKKPAKKKRAEATPETPSVPLPETRDQSRPPR